MSAPRLLVTGRPAGPQTGVVCNVVPPQFANVPIVVATEKTVPGCNVVTEDMRQKLGLYYVQQYRMILQAQGLVFGPGGSQYSGFEDLLP